MESGDETVFFGLMVLGSTVTMGKIACPFRPTSSCATSPPATAANASPPPETEDAGAWALRAFFTQTPLAFMLQGVK